MKELKSQWGSGIGGPVEVTNEPNKPSYDRVESPDSTNRKIMELLEGENITSLNEWERDFLIDVYSAERLTRRQHKKVAAIYRLRITNNDQT